MEDEDSVESEVGGALKAALVVCFCALLLANLELQIEGEHGWAAKLPAWRVNFLCMRGKTPLTGYHVGLWTTMVAVFLGGAVTPFLLSNESVSASLVLVSLTELGTVLLVEDVLWFCLNYKSPINHFGSVLSQYKGYFAGAVAVCAGWLVVYWSAQRSALRALAVFATHAGVAVVFCTVARVARPIYKTADQAMHRVQASQGSDAAPAKRVGVLFALPIRT